MKSDLQVYTQKLAVNRSVEILHLESFDSRRLLKCYFTSLSIYDCFELNILCEDLQRREVMFHYRNVHT